jgi:dihydroorotate dehydrogenase electron transfer subunit
MKAKVLKAEKENEKVTRLVLDCKLDCQPGQFVMVWIPGVDEKPISISESKPSLEICVANAGPVSEKISKLRAGDEIFVRGPLGRGFERKGKRWLLVGGGYGFGPLRFLARVGKEEGKSVEAILGARTKGLLMRKACCETCFVTDDGSEGKAGTSVDELERRLAGKSAKTDVVFSCGPERMMEAVAKACKKRGVQSQLLVERYMKCGFGICGHCAMGGWLACTDGPAIYGEEALKNPEFGKVRQDRCGCKKPL